MKRGYLNLFSPGTDEKFIDDNGNTVEVPNRDTLFTADGKNYRVGSLLKVLTGLSVTKELSEAGKFLQDLGYKDWRMVTRTMSPGFKRFETAFLKEHFMTVVDEIKEGSYMYDNFMDRAKNRPLKDRKKLPDKTFVRDLQRGYVDDRLKEMKASIDNYIGEIDEGGYININLEVTRMVTANQKYRRLNKQKRKNALNEQHIVAKAFGVEKLDLTNVEHLEALIFFAKGMKDE